VLYLNCVSVVCFVLSVKIWCCKKNVGESLLSVICIVVTQSGSKRYRTVHGDG